MLAEKQNISRVSTCRLSPVWDRHPPDLVFRFVLRAPHTEDKKADRVNSTGHSISALRMKYSAGAQWGLSLKNCFLKSVLLLLLMLMYDDRNGPNRRCYQCWWMYKTEVIYHSNSTMKWREVHPPKTTFTLQSVFLIDCSNLPECPKLFGVCFNEFPGWNNIHAQINLPILLFRTVCQEKSQNASPKKTHVQGGLLPPLNLTLRLLIRTVLMVQPDLVSSKLF